MDAENQVIEQPAEPTEATREDLIAAVKEAGGTDSVLDAVAEEAVAAGDPPPAPVEEEPRIAAILKAREKAAAEREAARNEAEEIRARAKAEAEQLREQAREEARRDAEAERERLRAEFRSSPINTLKALGDPQDIVDAVLRDGTPEARALAKMQAELAEAKKLGTGVEEAKRELAAMREQIANEKRSEMLAKAQQSYLETATPEKAPYLNTRYDAEEILDKANRLSITWQNKGLQLHRDFDFNDLTQYLEMEAKKKITSSSVASPPAQQVSAGAPAKEPGLAPKVPANGSRTLSAASGSERRTSPKPFSEMTRDEQRAALIEEAAAARRANPGAKY